MRTTIDIDDALMRKAMRLSGLTTKKAVVEAALRLFIQTHSQAGIQAIPARPWLGKGNLFSDLREALGSPRRGKPRLHRKIYSHSMVPGGFEVMS
jgi:Bacterial antitoxin of type II TA system, VapB